MIDKKIIKEILEKLEILKYIIPVPTDYEKHTFEDWYNLEDDEELHWIIPSEDILTYILEMKCVDMEMMDIYDDEIIDIKITYDGKDFNFDTSELDNQISELYKDREELKYDIEKVLPTKKYVGNCSKEFCEKIVDKFWEREYERIQYIDFPPLSFKIATPENCLSEFDTLLKNPGVKNTKNYSNLVKFFHRSIIYANVGNSLSPYEGWKSIQEDPEVFKNFYRNRLRCSDWFKGKDKTDYLLRGVVMENTYGIGLSTSRKFQLVTYFKPRFAKYIIEKYLNEYNTIFDPFSGYSGRMIGALACDKSYIGQDLCEYSISESKEIYSFIKDNFNINATAKLSVCDTISEFGEYECLFTCPPYGNIENWPGVKSINNSCDKWIDICLSNYHCNKYVFVVDDKIEKYKKYIVEDISNTSHFATNKEYIVVIDKADLKDIKFDDINGNYIESNHKEEYSTIGEYLYNIFNQKLFNQYLDCPIELEKWINLIYDKFKQKHPIIRNTSINKISLKDNDKDILLACSGGLDSIYQIYQLKDLGYNVIIYHMKNANAYENMQAYKSLKEFADKTGIKMVNPELKKNLNSNYNKQWAENPIKNQMILLNMIDYCYKNGINHISMDGSWEFSIDEVTAGIDVADAPENYDYFLECINKLVDNLVFIKTEHLPKIEKIKYLDSIGIMDYVYSCLGSGKLNEYRHNKTEEKYNIKLFKHNCGCSCRKCAHHNLLMYYDGYKEFPEEFINKCWNILAHNGYASRNMLFGDDIPLEQKIKNLYVE